MEELSIFISIIPESIKIGLIYSIMAMGVYITYKILGLPISDTGVVNTKIGKCHKYKLYEILPIKTIGLNDSSFDIIVCCFPLLIITINPTIATNRNSRLYSHVLYSDV